MPPGDLGLLEVGHELAATGVDAEEVVHVGGRGLGLRPSLRDQRDRAGDAAVAGAGADPGTGPLEPQLDGERRAAQLVAVPRVAYWLVPLSWSACWPAARMAVGAATENNVATSAKITASVLPRIAAPVWRERLPRNIASLPFDMAQTGPKLADQRE